MTSLWTMWQQRRCHKHKVLMVSVMQTAGTKDMVSHTWESYHKHKVVTKFFPERKAFLHDVSVT